MVKQNSDLDAVAFYQRHAGEYNQLSHQRFYQSIARQLLDLVPDDLTVGSILEVGAGTGFATIAATEKYPGAKILAIEPSAAMLAVAKATISAVQWDCRLVTELAGSCFDLVFASMSYHWLSREEQDHLIMLAGEGCLAIALPTTAGFADVSGNRALKKTVFQLRPKLGWAIDNRQTNRVVSRLRRSFSAVDLTGSSIRETFISPGEFGCCLHERGVLYALFGDRCEEAQECLLSLLDKDEQIEFDWEVALITAAFRKS